MKQSELEEKGKTGAVLPRDMRRFLKAPANSTEVIFTAGPVGLGALGALNVAAASDMVVYGPMAADLGISRFPSCATRMMGSTGKSRRDVVEVDNRGRIAELPNCRIG